MGKAIKRPDEGLSHLRGVVVVASLLDENHVVKHQVIMMRFSPFIVT